MEHRIRAAALVVQGDSILLVKHQAPTTGVVWWVPPGGGLEGSESVYDCVRRETFEEAGVSVELGAIVYVRQFIDHELQRHHLELFLLAGSYSGAVTTENVIPNDADAEYIQEARFMFRDEMRGVTVYPEVLKDGFWEDLKRGFSTTTYLGIQWGGGVTGASGGPVPAHRQGTLTEAATNHG
jgi:ADP-ribose pyrophosphatase YjhB (NUDIX family)